MTGNFWTDKHNEFCLKHRLPSSVRALWQWLLETKEENSGEIEFSLKEFNTWVEKQRGKGYDPKTLKSAAQKLLEIGAFIDEKCSCFKWCWKRWILRPINLLVNPLKPRKKVQESGEIPDSEALTPHSATEDALAAAASNSEIDILETCEEAGIPFHPSEAGNVLKHLVNDVREAIAHFWCRGGHNKIENPQGWLIECLKRRWWEDVTGYYSAHSPIAKRQMQQWIKAGRSLGEHREATANA